MRSAWIVVSVVLAGCGGAQAAKPKLTPTPTPKPVNASRQIRDVVLRSYTGTDPQDCARIFTSAFLTDAFGGVAGCKKHVKERTQRTVRVISIHRQGPVADAKIRVDRFDSTVKLVLTGEQWQVDDTISADSGSARTNLAQARKAITTQQAEAPKPLGAVASFKPIPGVGPRTRFAVQVLKVVQDGRPRAGYQAGTGPVTNEFGAVTTDVKFRVVNVRVRLTANGPKPFKGTFSAFVTGTNGRRWPQLQHIGRLPDWSDGESKGIKPGHSVTRWLSFGIPAASQARIVELQPELLSRPNTVVTVQPDTGRWLARRL